MKEVKLTRQQLYDLVWGEPLSSLTKKFVITEEDLRKVCKKFEVPLPKASYWLKLQLGTKAVTKTPLGVRISEERLLLNRRKEGDEKEKTKKERQAILQKEIERDKKLNLIVSEKLYKPENLIISVRENLLQNKVGKKEKEIVKSSKGELSIQVSAKNIERALCFMDTLIKTLKLRGHEIILKNGQTLIKTATEEIPVSCREKLSRVIIESEYGNRKELQANGLLSFRIEEKYNIEEWVDGKKRVEELLSNIICSLEMKA